MVKKTCLQIKDKKTPHITIKILFYIFNLDFECKSEWFVQLLWIVRIVIHLHNPNPFLDYSFNYPYPNPDLDCPFIYAIKCKVWQCLGFLPSFFLPPARELLENWQLPAPAEFSIQLQQAILSWMFIVVFVFIISSCLVMDTYWRLNKNVKCCAEWTDWQLQVGNQLWEMIIRMFPAMYIFSHIQICYSLYW